MVITSKKRSRLQFLGIDVENIPVDGQRPKRRKYICPVSGQICPVSGQCRAKEAEKFPEQFKKLQGSWRTSVGEIYTVIGTQAIRLGGRTSTIKLDGGYFDFNGWKLKVGSHDYVWKNTNDRRAWYKINERRRISFPGGPIGVQYNPDSHEIIKVRPKKVAENEGIQTGWRMMKLNGEEFASDIYQAVIVAGEAFTLTFCTCRAEKNVFVDTAIGHRSWEEWKRRTGQQWVKDHNSYLVVIPKRTEPLHEIDMHYHRVAMHGDQILNAKDQVKTTEEPSATMH